jgi:IS605 OrfB family transposase
MASSYRPFTFQTRFEIEGESEGLLSQFAGLFSGAMRSLFSKTQAGFNPLTLKSCMMEEHGLTARQYNAVRVELDGKIAACKQQQSAQIQSLKERIVGAGNKLAKASKRIKTDPKAPLLIHRLKRKKIELQHRLDSLLATQKAGKVALCFGGKPLFRAQFSLKENGYKDHDDWLADWTDHRSNQFTTLGSKDETGGNQTCTASIEKDGSITLRLRLPDALAKDRSKYLTIPNLRFAYGHEKICQALKNETAVHHRFYKDKKGWTVFTTVGVPKTPSTTSSENGVLGVDINVDHVAVTELDRCGNPISTQNIPLVTYGKDTHQTEAIIGDVCATLVDLAKTKGKPLVYEGLDFSEKKRSLHDLYAPKYARMLSSFAYTQFAETLQSRAWRVGIDLHAINPAYTSVIGRVKYAPRYNLSVHQAAACVIGRRFLSFSERAPRCQGPISDGKSGHVTFPLPARNRGKHVWSFWANLSKKLKTALAAHFRTSSTRPGCPP